MSDSVFIVMALIVQFEFRMRRAAIAVAAAFLTLSPAAFAQEPPPPLPRVVLDLHGIVPVFPNDNAQLASSRMVVDPQTGAPRSMLVSELPGAGLGGRIGLNLYLFRWKVVTFGITGEALIGASSAAPEPTTTVALTGGTTATLVGVTERLRSGDGQLSLNFGSGHGWSYLSGGIGRSQWSIVPAGASAAYADTQVLPTMNYGGGAHWSIRRHLGFSLDVRVYEIQPGASGSPRTRLFVVGAGAFLK
jgi:hypothetical protein